MTQTSCFNLTWHAVTCTCDCLKILHATLTMLMARPVRVHQTSPKESRSMLSVVTSVSQIISVMHIAVWNACHLPACSAHDPVTSSSSRSSLTWAETWPAHWKILLYFDLTVSNRLQHIMCFPHHSHETHGCVPFHLDPFCGSHTIGDCFHSISPRTYTGQQCW